jgi:hypothetical protein
MSVRGGSPQRVVVKEETLLHRLATSGSSPVRSRSGSRILLNAALAPRPISRGRCAQVGRRRVLRWLNDQAVWSISITGQGVSEEDAEALIPFMLLDVNSSPCALERLSASQREEFAKGEVVVTPPPSHPPKPAKVTIQGCLEGCWSRVAQPFRKTLIKEFTRCGTVMGGERSYRPWLLDAEALCARALEGELPCAPTEEGGMFHWGGGEEARTTFTAPVSEASGEEGVLCAMKNSYTKSLLCQVAAFYGVKTLDGEMEHSVVLIKGGQGGGGGGGGGGGNKPSPEAVKAARAALTPAWRDTVKDYGLKEEDALHVPLVFIWCQTATAQKPQP